MPNPRKISQGTSWEITLRVDGRGVQQCFASKTLALNALDRARTHALDGLGITPATSHTSTRIRGNGGAFVVEGKPTLHGVTKPVELKLDLVREVRSGTFRDRQRHSRN